MKVRRLLLAFLLGLVGSLSLCAQSNPNLENGFKPYGTYSGSNVDTVNLENGNLILHIPMPFGLPQRGKIQPSYFFGINSKLWSRTCSGAQCWWYYGSMVPSQPPLPLFKGAGFDTSLDVAVMRTYDSTVNTIDPSQDLYTENVTQLATSDGATHKLVAVSRDPTYDYATISITADVSGYVVVQSNPDANGIPQTVVVQDKAGNIYSTGAWQTLSVKENSQQIPDPNNPGQFGWLTTTDRIQAATVSLVTDTNGNQIVFAGQDTMGRAITSQGFSGTTSTSDYTGCVSPPSQPISSATISTYTGFNGAGNQVKLCYSNISLSTDFGVAGTTECCSPSAQVSMIVSIVFFVDGSTWSFQYDSYANLTYVGLPLGGNIQYQWVNAGIPGPDATVSRAVSQRTVTDNNGNTYVWKYSYGSGTYPNPFTNVMTDPLGNDSVSTFTLLNGSTNSNNDLQYFATTTKHYQGSQGSGTLLKQEDMQYYSNGQNGNNGENNVANGFVTQITTTMNGQQSIVTRTPDPGGYGSTVPNFGVVTAEKEYDFGGALLKETDTSYTWQSGANAGNYLAANLIALPLTVQVKNSNGNICAETDNGYDDPNYLTTFSGAIPGHVAPPNSVRGNLTSSSRRITNTACSITSGTPSVTSHTNWYDTGEVYQMTDPLGNVTTHTYDLAYDGAYSTKTCNPKNQCVSGTYDFSTGILTSFTNANATTQASGNTPGDSAHTSTYAYDALSRMTTASFPPDPANGNQQEKVQFTYPMPLSLPFVMTRTKNITSALTDSVSTTYDGLGRPYKTVHNSAGSATVITQYDGLDHVTTVTNPYYSTSDPTYGTVQTQYDALGRVTQTTLQDGGISTTDYSGFPSVKAIDPAGKMRQTRSDALGRLIEVDEPPGLAGGVNPTASIPLSGALQLGNPNGPNDVHARSDTPFVMANVGDFYYLDSNNHVREASALSSTGDWAGWTNADITAIVSAPAAASNSQLTAYFDASGRTYVLYVTSSQHLEVLYYNNGWLSEDLTTTFGNVLAASNTPILMASPGDFYYQDTNGHIREANLLSNGTWAGWTNFDAMAATGATAAITGSQMSGVRLSNGDTFVLYIGTNQHLGTVYYNGNWLWQDITTSFGNVLAASNASIIMLNSGDFYYEDTNGHIREATVLSNGTWAGWSNFDTTAATGATPAVTGSQMNGVKLSNGETFVLYVGSNQHLDTIYYNGNWLWQDISNSFYDVLAASATPIGQGGPGDFYYLDSSGHAREANLLSNGTWASWTNADITYLTDASAAGPTSRLLAARDSSGRTYVLDANAIPHPQALWYDGWNWNNLDLGVLTGQGYDSGTISLTVGGFSVTVCYGYSSNPSCSDQPVNATPVEVAAALAQALNVSSSPVTAVASGSTVNVTWKSTNPTNTDISGLSVTHDQPGTFTSPSFSDTYATLYSYDPLGNLLTVNQKGDGSQSARVRNFTYDTLSRLLSSQNPESGTISYMYDNDGNMLQKTSPAPNQTGSGTQTISYCYDSLNRVTGKAYSAQNCTNGQLPSGTAVASYAYDNATNAIGHLISLTDTSGSASYSYDILGRMSGESRTVNPGSPLSAVTKSLSYAYNLDSSLNAVTYPSGSVITYTPDAAGRVVAVTDNAHSINYLTSATFEADNGVTGFINGHTSSFAGITNTFSYNKRLQPVTMSAASPSATVFSMTYDFHAGAGDNGNIFTVTNNKDTTRTQTFTYDSLNRLTSAQNSGTNCSSTTVNGRTEYWGNNYGYDPWGNLLSKSVTKCSAENLSVSVNTNNQYQSTYAYDAAGNMINDPTDGVTATYDPENRILTATAHGAGTTYLYDGNGTRLAKTTGGNSPTGTIYWYAAVGIVAESDLSGNLQHEYVFYGGQRIARKDLPANSVLYYYSDHLKKASVITDSAGNIKAESDYYPWGGELQLVNNDTNDYKFTGKKRDLETGLDYFGARYYSNGMGRFLTADWSASPATVPYAHLENPQTLNLYSYVDNNPASGMDADGHSAKESMLYNAGSWGNIFIDSYTITTWYGNALSTSINDATNIVALVGLQTSAAAAAATEALNGVTGEASTPGGSSAASSQNRPFPPCDKLTAADLDYVSDGGKTHIEQRHMQMLQTNILPPKGPSQYFFDDPNHNSTTTDQYFQAIQIIDAYTFEHGSVSQSIKNKNFIFVATIPPQAFFMPSLQTAGRFIIGHDYDFKSQSWRGPTDVNTLVVGPDCRTVQTSHPGEPL